MTLRPIISEIHSRGRIIIVAKIKRGVSDPKPFTPAPGILPEAREANGRKQRGKVISLANVAQETRQRLYGLSEKDASDQKAGSVVGRMVLSGILKLPQYNAAIKFSESRNAYLRAIGAKQDYREPKSETQGDGDYVDFCKTAILRWNQIQAVLLDLTVELRSPAPMSALDNFINRDFYVEHLEGDLKLALNRLAKLFYGAQALDTESANHIRSLSFT